MGVKEFQVLAVDVKINFTAIFVRGMYIFGVIRHVN